MKKLLLVLAIGAFVACNDAGTGEAEKKDTTVTPASPAPDSTATPVDTLKVDSAAAKAVDTTKK